MSISDELRRQANCIRSLNSKTHTYKDPCKIERLADRIDSEMAELPKDADGVPIHVNDTVYLDDGRRACVTEIDIMDDREFVICWNGKTHVPCPPSGITHERPDSWERIADDLEDFDGINGTLDAEERMSDIANRIRRLAERDEERRAASSACTSTSTCTSTPTSGLTIAYGMSSHDDGFCSGVGEPVEEAEHGGR